MPPTTSGGPCIGRWRGGGVGGASRGSGPPTTSGSFIVQVASPLGVDGGAVALFEGVRRWLRRVWVLCRGRGRERGRGWVGDSESEDRTTVSRDADVPQTLSQGLTCRRACGQREQCRYVWYEPDAGRCWETVLRCFVVVADARNSYTHAPKRSAQVCYDVTHRMTIRRRPEERLIPTGLVAHWCISRAARTDVLRHVHAHVLCPLRGGAARAPAARTGHWSAQVRARVMATISDRVHARAPAPTTKQSEAQRIQRCHSPTAVRDMRRSGVIQAFSNELARCDMECNEGALSLARSVGRADQSCAGGPRAAESPVRKQCSPRHPGAGRSHAVSDSACFARI